MTRLVPVILLLLIGCSPKSPESNAVSTPLPTPSGPYPIGTSIFHISPRVEGTVREMMVQVWYPAQDSQSETELYLPDTSTASAMEKDQYMNISDKVLDGWRFVRTHAHLDVPVAVQPKLFPLLMFSHGFGVSRSNYTSFAEDFASQGFIVAAIDHPDAGMMILPDGTVRSMVPDPSGPDHRVMEMAEEASSVLDQMLDSRNMIGRFAVRIDRESIGMLGHSLGGAAALNVGLIDPRFKACADLDGYPFGEVMQKGVPIPFLAMLQQPGGPVHVSDSMRVERDRYWATVIGKRNTRAMIVTIRGTSHFNFSDFPFMVPDSLMRRNGGTLEPWRGHQIMMNILRSFFAQYLSTAVDQAAIDSVARTYTEVTIKSVVPRR